VSTVANVTAPVPSNKAPLASAVVTLVEKLALDSVIEPEPSNKLTLVLKDALDSVIEPDPSNKLTLLLTDEDTLIKLGTVIPATLTDPNDPVETAEPLIVAKLPLLIRMLSSITSVITFVSATLYPFI
jgi:hypothetical protein